MYSIIYNSKALHKVNKNQNEKVYGYSDIIILFKDNVKDLDSFSPKRRYCYF